MPLEITRKGKNKYKVENFGGLTGAARTLPITEGNRSLFKKRIGKVAEESQPVQMYRLGKKIYKKGKKIYKSINFGDLAGAARTLPRKNH